MLFISEGEKKSQILLIRKRIRITKFLMSDYSHCSRLSKRIEDIFKLGNKFKSPILQIET